MSLIERKPRPIATRDKDPDRLRDDRLFIVACDDRYAPQQYFGFFRFTRVKIHVVPTENGTSVAESVLERLLQFDHQEDDERWMLLDTDHVTEGTHLSGFLAALRNAEDRGVKVALSKPCFELWLLLHHTEAADVVSLTNARSVENALRQNIGEYNKTKLKEEHYPQSLVARAYERAQHLDAGVQGGAIPQSNTTRVYQLWKAIASKSLTSQFPEALHGMLPQKGEDIS
jgi:hypothetical protein